jgi:nucleoside-diphosphate-sugar epimerase
MHEMITLTGHGALAEAYLKVNPEAYVHSFRSLPDDKIESILKNTTILIHNSAGQTKEDAEGNLQLTKRTVYQVIKHNPSIKFLYIGSMSYLNEHGYLPESRMSAYAYSKFIGEKFCQAVIPQIRIIRFSSLFYRNPERDGLSYMISEAVFKHKIILINEGIQTRDWLPIGMAAKEIHRVITTSAEPITTVASGNQHTFFSLAKIIQKYTACTIEFKRSPVIKQNYVLSKFIKTVDVNIEDEIKSYVNHLKQN